MRPSPSDAPTARAQLFERQELQHRSPRGAIAEQAGSVCVLRVCVFMSPKPHPLAQLSSALPHSCECTTCGAEIVERVGGHACWPPTQSDHHADAVRWRMYAPTVARTEPAPPGPANAPPTPLPHGHHASLRTQNCIQRRLPRYGTRSSLATHCYHHWALVSWNSFPQATFMRVRPSALVAF